MNKNSFVYNNYSTNVLHTLEQELLNCSQFKISVAFITFSGIQILEDTLRTLQKKGIQGEVLTSTYLNFTQPKALEHIARYSNIKLKIYVPTSDRGFHTKGYLFKHEKKSLSDDWSVLIGSSNITDSALKSNMEWNLLHVNDSNASNNHLSSEVLNEFNRLWNSKYTKNYSQDFLIAYKSYIEKISVAHAKNQVSFSYNTEIEPNIMQKEAISKLEKLRRSGQDKALAIAATGSGKTYMSVFDAMQFKPKRLLFIVHREVILEKAKLSFDAILRGKDKDYSSGIFSMNKKNYNVKYVFAMRDTLRQNLNLFSQDAFDYIVIDEAHHAVSPSYKNILNYFKPKFLLGLTATPERRDEGDVFSIFDNNVAVEIRLRDALEYEIVCPFHYFGVTDFEGIDYDTLKTKPGDKDYIAEVSKLLMIGQRVDYIIEKLKFYDHDGAGKWKALGFCASLEHAEFMEKEFNKRFSPIKNDFAVALSGKDSEDIRNQYIEKLESQNDPLNIIFTVDIFNEGVDIPTVNTILMLRPTQSPIVFIQQLGRGLRKIPNKDFVTVLDFIGNYKNSFLMAIALNGKKNYDRDSLKVAVKTDFADIPGRTHIFMDEITKKQILKQLEQEKFFAKKYLKENYLSFKESNRHEIPMLCDYLKHDGAYDPMNFTVKNFSTYYDFVKDIDSIDFSRQKIEFEPSGYALLKMVHTLLLPATRPYDLAILKILISNTSHQVPISSLHKKIKVYIDDPDPLSIRHSINFLKGEYFDASEKKAYESIFIKEDKDNIFLSNSLSELFNSPNKFKVWLIDAIDYGLLRYEQEFSVTNYGYPFFKLYQRYSMRDTALLTSYEKTHSSFRGQGLITSVKGEYLIFVDLYKKEGIKDSINYDDRFLTPSEFQWQSPNSTRQDSSVGVNLINNTEKNIHLHLFVRKYPEVESVTSKFIYLGKVDTIKNTVHGNKPITMNFKLENEVRADIYSELTTIVEAT